MSHLINYLQLTNSPASIWGVSNHPLTVLPKHVMNLTDKDEPRENVPGVDQQTVCFITTPKYSAFPVNFSNNNNKDTSTAKNKE